nr:MAG TPA: hypothetical protein [Caudoviricetes sp.]
MNPRTFSPQGRRNTHFGVSRPRRENGAEYIKKRGFIL